MADLIDTGDATIRKIPRSRVFLSEKLGRAWDEVPFLYCDHLKIVAAPDVDEAVLSYVYGPILREPEAPGISGSTAAPPNASNAGTASYDEPKFALYDPQNLNGFYCKVVVEKSRDEGGPESGTQDDDIVWYGVIEIDDRDVQGSTSGASPPGQGQGQGALETLPRGRQKITAYGLARLLERTIILSSRVGNTNLTGDLPIEIWDVGFGIPFNGYRPGEYQDRGNRSGLDYTVEGVHVFSNQPQQTVPWDAYEAARYVLQFNRPLDGNEDDCCDWTLDADPKSLNWYDITVQTDRRSTKSVLDELISRKRGVSYWVEYNEDEGNGSRGLATVHVFTFARSDIPLPSGKTLPGNANTRELDFENAWDVEVRLVNSVATRYDQVVAMGEFATSTCTLSLNPENEQIEEDWTAAELSTWKQAASLDSDYTGLDPLEQRQRNERFRAADQLRNVFRRWQISSTFLQRTWNFDNRQADYLIAPLLETDAPNALPLDGGIYNPVRAELGEDLWNMGLVIESQLPFKDTFDYSGTNVATTDFTLNPPVLELGPGLDAGELTGAASEGQPRHLKPMFFAPTDTDDGIQRWELLERMADQAIYEFSPGRFSATVSILQQRPAFEIHVSGQPQYFLAKQHITDLTAPAAAGLGEIDPMHDPAVLSSGLAQAGINYEDIRCTITLRLQGRVQQSAEVDDEEPIAGGIDAGPQKRILYLHVKDARLDYVVPWTVVAVSNGVLVYSTSGGFVRDDRFRLADIAKAAAEWYGRARQSVMLRLKQVRQVALLGWLITDVGGEYSVVNVNTPVTSISFDLLHGITEYSTSFADLEFE